MKLVGIGDLFIPKEYIESGFSRFSELGVDIQTIDWNIDSFEELQKINLLIEVGGPEAYDPPSYIYDACKDADIIITQFCPIARHLIDACENLKIIGVLRAGYENVDVDYADSKGILVHNTPGRNADSVADFTIGMLLAECRNIAKGHLGIKNGDWIREYPNTDSIPDLPGKTVGIVGLGEIGLKVAKRLIGFDVKLLGYDPFVKDPPYDIIMCSLEELVEESDFVTIHARYTKETKHLINKKLIDSMKRTAYLINSSRSAIVDECALYDALKEGRIAGAALDVFDKEPPGKEYPLVMLDNVTLTPHMAGGSKDAFLNSPKKLAGEMVKLWQRETPKYLLNNDKLCFSKLGLDKK
jgi:D-3-phosphoglycerate dehydrogenase